MSETFQNEGGIEDEVGGHKCGVVAMADTWIPRDSKKPRRNLFPALLNITEELSNRGRDAHGIAIPDGNDHLFTHKGIGTMRNSMQELLQSGRFASAGIGHTLYTTSYKGRKNQKLTDRQKLKRAHPVILPGRNDKPFGFEFNGNVSELGEHIDKLKSAGVELPPSPTDTLVLANLVGLQLRNRRKLSLPEAVGTALENVSGAHNGAVILPDGEMVVWRDPLAMRPLEYAEFEGIAMAASENQPFIVTYGNSNIHARSLKGGEGLHMRPGQETKSMQLWPEQDAAHCFFEWIYFGKRLSTLDGVDVYRASTMFGEALADMDVEWTEPRWIVPVPNSAKHAAQAYGDKSGQPYADLLMRQTDDRSFIAASPEDRAAIIRAKIYALKDRIKPGSIIVLVEDSVVRSTTIREIVKMVREILKPREIHVRVACPPILNPCYYGIDMKTMDQLFARQQFYGILRNGAMSETDLCALAQNAGVHSLKYLTVTAVAEALGMSESELCMACVTGKYPTTDGQKLYQLEYDHFLKERRPS